MGPFSSVRVSPERRNGLLAEPPAQPSPKRLSFAAMLREDEGEGVLLTELACQSDLGADPLAAPAGSLTRQAGSGST
jgi:hypothetical protein